MIVGSGLIARAFAQQWQTREDVCLYAAGVSNSSGADAAEFARERLRLTAALGSQRDAEAFVYFGTCSVGDAELQHTPYVQHKLAMEALVWQHPRPIIFRLPQVAGHTPNPHTLLNFLYARIARSEAFTVWQHAYRNIIDVSDVLSVARFWMDDPAARQQIVNIANPHCLSMLEIVHAMAQLVGKPAVYRCAERGYHYPIDVSAMLPFIAPSGIDFEHDYLPRVLRKYYEPA
jgi:nucleoside-diphosphate-sugar epimerase